MTLPVLALVPPRRVESLVARDGGYAELDADGISVFDPAGRLLIRYEDGALVVRPCEGDLVLGSATGAVRLQAATDVVMEAQRDVSLRAPRTVSLGNEDGASLSLEPQGAKLAAKQIALEARATRIEGESMDVAVSRLVTTAKEIVTVAEKLETSAGKAVIRSREMVHEVTGLLTERLGRFRGAVKEAFALRTGRTDLRSKEDTSIDGKRVLLG